MPLLVNSIGRVSIGEEGMFIDLDAKYAPALKELDGFSHVNVIWWFNDSDDEESRNILETLSPYKKGPQHIGVFATRSPFRPNPIAITTVQILNVDLKNARIAIAYIDANPGSPVIDLKPYTPSLDRVERPGVPEWCSHWPKSIEESGCFDWESEFDF